MADKPIVLVVDDEAFNVDYLMQELEDYGVSTISASNGIEALEQVKLHSPDLVLLDVMMPKMDGFEVLTRMKAEGGTRDIPVIIISANSDMAHVLKGIGIGAEDYLPKPFDPLLLKARVNASLEKKRFRNLERKYLQGLERELEIGRKIQQGFLPAEIPAAEGWELGAFFRAAREVSGDFYDAFELPGGRLALMVGDVTDKGVGAALYMALYRSLLRAYLSTNGFAAENGPINLEHTVSFVNQYICSVHTSEMYLTAFVALLDVQAKTLDYVSAGHDHPLLLRGTGKLEEILPTGPAIGVLEESKFRTQQIQLLAGDTLLIYTDGLLDLQNKAGDAFDGQRLRTCVQAPSRGAKAVVASIASELDAFSAGAKQYDDLTMLALSRMA